MKKNVILSLFIIFYGCNTPTAQKTEVIKKMTEEVYYLSSDMLEGRATGSQAEKKAANYISEKFKSYGLIPKGTSGYFQYFETPIKKNPHSEEIKKNIEGINVIGYIDHGKKETIIIGAHYDHIGFGEFGSRYDGENEIHNGADDNASGVSILLNLASSLNKIPKYNYLFIAFSGEEHGLFGSSYYAKNPTIDLTKVRFMMNFDMVGRLRADNTLAINGIGTSNKWKKLINISNKFNFNLKTTDSGIGPSDHTSFYLQDIPSIHFFTGQHEDYHKPSDDADKINFDGMYEVYSYVKEIIKQSSYINEFDFQETKSESDVMPSFKVTLGVMPDYMFDGEGMRIDGISKGKTAAKFGFKKGDIVVKMGELEITNMKSYMLALSKFEKGDSIIVVVNRANQSFNLPTVFQ